MEAERTLYISYVFSEKYNLFLIRSIFTTRNIVSFEELSLDDKLEVLDNGYLSGFFDEDELIKFAYGLCDKFKLAQVCLLSTASYNASLESAKRVNNLMHEFLVQGNVVENPDQVKRGFFFR